MKMSFAAVISLLIVLALGNGCSNGSLSQNKGSPANSNDSTAINAWNAPVGEVVPGVTLYEGWEDLRFLPEPPNATGGWTDSVHISANGLSLYFSYARVDFFKFYLSGGTDKQITGPDRTGMNGNEFKIFRSDLTSNGWNLNFHPVNSSDGTLPESSQSLNAAEDLIVFTRWTLDGPNINSTPYFSTKDGSGAWSAPQVIPLDSPCWDDNFFVVGNMATGVSVYFESQRNDPTATSCGTKRRLFYSRYQNNSFTPIQLIGGLNADVNLGDEDDQPFVTLDEEHLYWSYHRSDAYGIYMADRVSPGNYTNVRPVIVPTRTAPVAGKVIFIGEANIAEVPEGQLMYLMCGIALNENNGNTFLDADNIRLKICRARKPSGR